MAAKDHAKVLKNKNKQANVIEYELRICHRRKIIQNAWRYKSYYRNDGCHFISATILWLTTTTMLKCCAVHVLVLLCDCLAAAGTPTPQVVLSMSHGFMIFIFFFWLNQSSEPLPVKAQGPSSCFSHQFLSVSCNFVPHMATHCPVTSCQEQPHHVVLPRSMSEKKTSIILIMQ